MEGLGRVLLVAGLQLRDAEQQSRFALAAQPALGEALGDLLDRLVVLPVAEIRQAEAHVLRPGGGGVGLLRDPRQACPVGRRGLLRALQQPLVLLLGALVGEDSLREDRKSTRLNSSHEWISYAVFCLKKKTP